MHSYSVTADSRPDVIEITRPLMTLTDDEGVPVVGVTKSASEVEAMEKASRLPDGTYYLDRPTATITVKREGVQPEPEPIPDPEPEPIPDPTPPTGDVPFGDVAALQALGLLPKYRDVGKTVSVDQNIEWGGQGGERGEIGHLPEDHSAFVAGHTYLLEGILEVAKQVPPKNMDHAHHPNLYWLPFLMTGDVQYIRNLELCHKYEMDWRLRPHGGSFGSNVSGRELAWNLRDLFQLAWAQLNGFTAEDFYIDALEANRDDLTAVIANPRPENETFSILRMANVYWASYGFSCWMENFLGMELCIGVRMGFKEWTEVAKWHYEHLEKRIANWGWKGCDANHIFFSKFTETATDWESIKVFATTQDWQSATPYSEAAMADPEYVAHPDDLIFLNTTAAGNRYTYPNRTHGMHQWALMAADIDTRAHGTANTLLNKINQRGDAVNYRHAFSGDAI